MNLLKINRILEIIYPDCEARVVSFNMTRSFQPVVSVYSLGSPVAMHHGPSECHTTIRVMVPQQVMMEKQTRIPIEFSISDYFNMHIVRMNATYINHYSDAIAIDLEVIMQDPDEFFTKVEKDIIDHREKEANEAIDKMLTEE